MDANHTGEIVTLSDTAKTVVEAAQALGIKVGQVASSIVFDLAGDPDPRPLLVITSGPTITFLLVWVAMSTMASQKAPSN
jgi:prolyl-tRNA editing enzyme YbaK/EbsC (Cys-tRNA(Pro) deacylase)